MQPRPPSSPNSSARGHYVQNTKFQNEYTLAQEEQHAAHGTLALLWRKVKSHADWQNHIQRREQSINAHRANSARRARLVRKEMAEHKEQVTAEREKTVAEKNHSRLVVKKDASVAHEEKDLRKIPVKKRKRREKTKEELEEISKQWVTTGRGAYNYSDLDNPSYFKAMLKAERDLHSQHKDLEMQRKKAVVAEIRRNEKEIMERKAGMTAKYNLPVKKKEDGEKKEEEEEPEEQEADGDEEDEFKNRTKIPGFSNLYLPEFHKTQGKAQRKDVVREKKMLEAKTASTKKLVDQDIDAAAKLLILHAHMIRKACVDAKQATKKEEEGEE